jgi:hypothetical protein
MFFVDCGDDLIAKRQTGSRAFAGTVFTQRMNCGKFD